MNRDAALAIIKRHEAELKQLGVVSLSLFGSTARGDASETSDVDVAVRLARDVPDGFEYFGRLADIERVLSSLLGVAVDVIHEPAARASLQQQIDQDRHLAY